jgi:hypothetical protein
MDDPFADNFTAGWNFQYLDPVKRCDSSFVNDLLEVADSAEIFDEATVSLPGGSFTYHVTEAEFIDSASNFRMDLSGPANQERHTDAALQRSEIRLNLVAGTGNQVTSNPSTLSELTGFKPGSFYYNLALSYY